MSRLGSSEITAEMIRKAADIGKDFAKMFLFEVYPGSVLTTYEHEFANHLKEYMETVSKLKTHPKYLLNLQMLESNHADLKVIFCYFSLFFVSAWMLLLLSVMHLDLTDHFFPVG